MRNGLLGSVATLLTGAAAWAQIPSPPLNLPPAASVGTDMPALLPAQPSLPAVAAVTDGKLGDAPCACLPNPADVCKPNPRVWASLEYLLWFNRNEANNTALATVGPIATGGVLRGPGVATVLGDHDINFGTFDGFRVGAGVWFNKEDTFGIEAGGFLLERRSNSTLLSDTPAATDANVFTRPVINALTGAENTSLIAFPSLLNGAIYDKATSQTWGVDSDLVLNWRNYSLYRIDLLAGFRYFDLLERFEVGQLSSFQPTAAGGAAIFDQFGTRNQFYGGQVGTRTAVNFGRIDATLVTKLAIGYTHETTDIAGNTISFGPGGTVEAPGGFLAQSSNSGHASRDRFSVLPETSLTLGYRITDRLSASVGYNFLYLSSVARPTEQVDRDINPNLVPILTTGGPTTPARPAHDFTGTDYWVQGVTFGISYKY